MAANENPSPSARPGAPKAPRGRRTLYAVLVFLFCVFVMDSLVGDRGLVALMRVQREYARLADQVAAVKAENARLKGLAGRLADDPATIEEIARRDLGMIKPGEKLFIVRDVPAPTPAR
jgi:cell division protein FtsB